VETLRGKPLKIPNFKVENQLKNMVCILQQTRGKPLKNPKFKIIVYYKKAFCTRLQNEKEVFVCLKMKPLHRKK
jgi:hypothetical protein